VVGAELAGELQAFVPADDPEVVALDLEAQGLALEDLDVLAVDR
jgi:hypothetical protein